jgi:hypothetical protein
MKRPDPRLARLAELARIIADRDLMAVAAAKSRCDATRSEIDALAAQRREMARQTDDPVLAALMGRQAEGLRRLQQRKLEALARQQTAQAQAAAKARPAYGRQLVLQRLAAKARGR